MRFSKKAEAGSMLAIVIIAALLFVGYIYNISTRDCSSNEDCKEGNYCGSDFSCHPFPAYVASPPSGNTFIIPSLIIGASLIACAFILRGWNNKHKTEKKSEEYIDLTKHHH